MTGWGIVSMRARVRPQLAGSPSTASPRPSRDRSSRSAWATKYPGSPPVITTTLTSSRPETSVSSRSSSPMAAKLMKFRGGRRKVATAKLPRSSTSQLDTARA